MGHIYYLNVEDQEMIDLISGKKRMIIRGWVKHKLRNDGVCVGDILYFIDEESDGQLMARGDTVNVYASGRMSCREELVDLILRYQNKLQLDINQLKKWVKNKYILLIEVENVEMVTPHQIELTNLFAAGHEI